MRIISYIKIHFYVLKSRDLLEWFIFQNTALNCIQKLHKINVAINGKEVYLQVMSILCTDGKQACLMAKSC